MTALDLTGEELSFLDDALWLLTRKDTQILEPDSDAQSKRPTSTASYTARTIRTKISDSRGLRGVPRMAWFMNLDAKALEGRKVRLYIQGDKDDFAISYSDTVRTVFLPEEETSTYALILDRSNAFIRDLTEQHIADLLYSDSATVKKDV